MDPETAKKVNELAKNLKELHMAASMEEATERAKEIIIGDREDNSKSISELMNELESEKKSLKKDKEVLDKAQKELKDVKALESKDDVLQEEQIERIQHVEQEIKDAEKDIKLIKENIEMAEKVQEEE